MKDNKQTTKIISITCKKCKEKLSSNKIINVVKENSNIYIKKYYLKNIAFKSKQLISTDNMYIYKKAKCLSCGEKIGYLICLSKPEFKDRINNVVLNEECVDIGEEEMENVNMKLIKQTDAFYSNIKMDNNMIDNFNFIVSFSRSNLKACAQAIQECVEALKVLVDKVTFLRDCLTNFFTAIIEKKDAKAIKAFIDIDKLERAKIKEEPKQSIKRKNASSKEEKVKKKKNKRKSK